MPEPYEASKNDLTPLVIYVSLAQMENLYKELREISWDGKSDLTLESIPRLTFRITGVE